MTGHHGPKHSSRPLNVKSKQSSDEWGKTDSGIIHKQSKYHCRLSSNYCQYTCESVKLVCAQMWASGWTCGEAHVAWLDPWGEPRERKHTLRTKRTSSDRPHTCACRMIRHSEEVHEQNKELLLPKIQVQNVLFLFLLTHSFRLLCELVEKQSLQLDSVNRRERIG